jgi:hypothetical protein
MHQPKRQTFEEQLGPENFLDTTGHVDITAVPVALHRKKRYIRESYIDAIGDSNRKRAPRSWVGNLGLFVQEVNEAFEAQGDYWLCRRCDRRGIVRMFSARATSSAAEHLKTYGLDVNSDPVAAHSPPSADGHTPNNLNQTNLPQNLSNISNDPFLDTNKEIYPRFDLI